MRKLGFIGALSFLAACTPDIQNKDAIKSGMIEYLNARPDKIGASVNVEISTISFSSSGNEAHATVMFSPKAGGAGMSMPYTLDRKGNKWVVRPHAEGGENPHGGAGLPAMPPNHPPVEQK